MGDTNFIMNDLRFLLLEQSYSLGEIETCTISPG